MPALSKQFQFVINTGTFTSVLIPSAATSENGDTLFNSTPEKGDGFFGGSDGLHTVSYTVTPNFAGTLTMQATLAVLPTPIDWFTVKDTTVTYNTPIVPASTTTHIVNFVGNFVWVRASIQRSADLPNGSVLFVNYNH